MKMLHEEIQKVQGITVENEDSVISTQPLLNVETAIDESLVTDEELKIEIHRKINEIDSYNKLEEKNYYVNYITKKNDLALKFNYFKENYSEMPKLYRDNCEKDGIDRSVCDYISSMTDRYAIKTFSQLYVPDIWRSKK